MRQKLPCQAVRIYKSEIMKFTNCSKAHGVERITIQIRKIAKQEKVRRFYTINNLGQYEILSEDLSGLENSDEMKTVPTELDAVIDGIHDLTVEEGIESLPRPWLPPLEERFICQT